MQLLIVIIVDPCTRYIQAFNPLCSKRFYILTDMQYLLRTDRSKRPLDVQKVGLLGDLSHNDNTYIHMLNMLDRSLGALGPA